ncbi:WecB/TagA/CpsF family glycosyltransferase [Mesobacillus subterraneus]|uniref:N-acetylglucosaminyldiphosphoundecaprenol N-acetyl-beta-D-mannosaminyltransferase n=1 Tax=Mesobacillus subterraneus TaxID=285983 RepID=A0A3R9EYQ1_9BACI|nr:WecB/TagA/CpsF family glycosyltransferase [Mesobacillus subterraneus]RSD25215.1 glycosyltransferase [Mesobacillus subterraneus]
MKNSLVNVLGIPFINKDLTEMSALLTKRINVDKKTFVVTANPEIVMHAIKDPIYNEIVNSADYVVPDGAGVILASRILGTPLKERVAGYDLTIKMLENANQNGWKIYLLGGKEDVNSKAVINIKKQYPDIKIAGNHHGFFDMEDDSVARDILHAKPDIVLVALGFPRQEIWVSKYFGEFKNGLFIGVGGTIDVLSGNVKRAPSFWVKLNLEWLYRLLIQPSRWRRMLVLPLFVLKVFSSKYKN